MSRVQLKRLGDIINFKRGYDLPHAKRKKGPYPVISSSGISGYHSEYKCTNEGIITGRYGTLGEVHYYNGKYWPHNTTLYATDFYSNEPKYLYYLLKSLGNLKTSDKSTVPGINRNDLHEIDIPFIQNRKDQRVIASVLSSLDAKIGLNNRINAELEQMAKTLYDYWFVQFDFPISAEQAAAMGKPELEGKPYKSSGGKMVYNAELKREIPEGWEVKTLACWIDDEKGGDWGKENEEGNYVAKVNCVRGTDINGLNGKGELKAPVRYILRKNTTKHLEPNDLIIEISGGSPTQSTGRMAYIMGTSLQRFENPIICSNFCKAISLKDDKQLFYFAYYWNLIYENDILFGWEGKTSGIKNLLFDSFVNHYKIPVAEDTLVEKFNAFVKPLEDKKQQNLRENQQLASLRDWLLPMLMNGQVTVKEAEEEVRQAMAAEPEAGYGKH